MPKFMLVYRSKPYKAEDISPEAMQQVMQVWNAWIGEGFAKGWMVDPGDALLPGGKVIDKKNKVSDGPFAEAKEIVGGYSIVLADDYHGALEKAKSCPALQDDGATIEVRELAGLSPPK
jgi:hypothetical protein